MAESWWGDRRTCVLSGSWTLMRSVYKDCSEREFPLAFTKSLYYPCDSQHIIKFLNWLYDRRAFSPLHGPGAEQQHLAVSQIHYVCTHLCNCIYVHKHMHSVYQYTARTSKARLSAIYNITLKSSATKNVIWHLIAFSRFCFFPLIFHISTHLWLQTVYILHSLTVFFLASLLPIPRMSLRTKEHSSCRCIEFYCFKMSEG